MFYKCKNKKMIIILIIAAIIILVIWGIEVWKVRKAFPQKTIQSCGYNEWISYTPDDMYIKADVSIAPVSCTIMTPQDFARQYRNVDGPFTGEVRGGRFLYNMVFEINIKNNSDLPVDITRLCTFFMAASPFNTSSNGVQYINENGKNDIKGHENATIKLLTRVNCDSWYPDSYNNYIKSDMYILISQYPVEKRLVFQIKE